MRQDEQSPVAVSSPPQVERVPPAPPRKRRNWGTNVALGVLAAAAVAALVPVWIRFATFNPAEGRLSPEDHPGYFPVLMVHLVTATVALVTCMFQVWPWLRRRHSRAHRCIGRVYVFCGALPAGFTALVLTLVWPFSAATSFGMILLSVLWMTVTSYGFVLRRQGRIADHRRWMLRSFALTVSVLLNEVIRPFILLRLEGQLHTRLAGSQDVLIQVGNTLGDLLSIILAVIAVEWWLERDLLRRSKRQRQRS